MSAEPVSQEPLVVTVQEAGDKTVLAAFGEIDMATREQLWEAVEAALTSGRSVEIDMSGVSFMGSAGANLLVTANELAERCDRTVRVLAPSSAVTRLLQITEQYERFVQE